MHFSVHSVVFQVARIQVQIQEMLMRRHSQHPSAQTAIAQLDSELMDITKVPRQLLRMTRKSVSLSLKVVRELGLSIKLILLFC